MFVSLPKSCFHAAGIRHLGQFHVQILCSPELPRAMAQAKAALDALRWQTYKQNQAQRQQDQQAQRLQGLKRPRNAGVAASQAAVKRARRGGRPVTPVTTALAAAQAGQVFPQTTPSTGDLLKVVGGAWPVLHCTGSSSGRTLLCAWMPCHVTSLDSSLEAFPWQLLQTPKGRVSRIECNLHFG